MTVWKYTVSRDQEAAITGYSGMASVVSVPAKVGGHPVEGIGDREFEKNTAIIRVVLPNGVTSVGGYAFFGCKFLMGITMPESVTWLGSSIIEGAAVEEVTIPKGR